MPSYSHSPDGPGADDFCDQVVAAKLALEKLRCVDDFISKSTSGDPHFDVELLATVNVTRAALLRYLTLLSDRT